MVLRFRGCESGEKEVPGSSPQGTLIGVIIYILYINPVCFPSEITLSVHDEVTQYWKKMDEVPKVTVSDVTLPPDLLSLKYMDDANLLEVIDINSSLASNIDRSGPLPFWEGSGKVLVGENTYTQSELNTIKKISDSREMRLNSKKTLVFVANFTDTHQFRPLLTVPGAAVPLERALEHKLLGY